MARRLGPVPHGEELSLVDHLDELRWRIVSSIGIFIVALAVAFWQNEKLLDLINKPLPAEKLPSTFGVAEAFTSTLMVSTYAALLAVSPLLIYHLYAFVIPAFKPHERRALMPLMLLAPFLFIAGVAFSYFVVVPAAVKFLLHFNDDQFNIQIRAREYYSFFGVTLGSVGLLFEMPVAILALVKIGVVTPKQLRENRRYAVLAIAVVAMLLPGTDPITMLLSMAPLIVLYEGTILLATVFNHRSNRAESADQGDQIDS